MTIENSPGFTPMILRSRSIPASNQRLYISDHVHRIFLAAITVEFVFGDMLILPFILFFCFCILFFRSELVSKLLVIGVDL